MRERLDRLYSHIERLLQEYRFPETKEALSTMEPADISEMLVGSPRAKMVLIFRLLPKDLAIEVFEHMEGSGREELLASFTEEEAAEIIEEMSDDDRTALLDELPAKTVKKLMQHLSPEERKIANRLLNYPEDSAGRIMTAEYIGLKASMTVVDALQHIRREARSKETIYTCFVMDRERRLKGVVDLEDIILAQPETLISDLMDDDPVHVRTTMDQEELARLMSRYDLHVIPVVDLEDRLVGIVTFDDVLDIVEEEATEDFERMAGIQPIDEKYLDTGVFTLAGKRLTWLMVCILTQALTSSILKYHESSIQSVVALTFFIPFLIDSGGNTGTQSSTLMIRGMTLGEIKWGNIGRVFMREAFTGLMLGAALALFGVFRAITLGTGTDVAVVVAVSLVAVVLIGNLAGVILPFAARALRFDPAIVSGPFITTVVDVVGLLVYFGIATRIMGLG
ncbi:MAG TPA: magnesium transporter [Synergistales bacterium]|jgi:magnesium transporter|nr:magnesium transporter [Synergistales bacterium]MDI9392948.1 magnesium transporter [Synergistota bacterium]HOP51553.1 magnesium transporter [Synergistales bacterium]HPQ77042.1 magnesium transporter [Synergistales bacterium]